jgi:hypothetical protein
VAIFQGEKMIYGVVGTLDRDTMMKFGLYNIKTGRFQRVASKKGNGKTMVLTYYGYRENSEQGRKVFSNFHTKFSVYKTAQEIFNDLGRLLDLSGKFGGYGTINDIIKNFDAIFANYPLKPNEMTELYELRSLYLEYYGSFVLLTEFQKFFNSLGTSTKTVKWIEGILTQLRKLGIDLMWDAQRPISAGNRSREYTETFLVPQKFHEDDLSPCDKDICKRDHLVYVYSDIPFREKELCILVCREVGQLYETDEIIGDNLCSPIEQSEDDQKKERAARKARTRKESEKEPEPEPEIPVITNKAEFIEGLKEGMQEALDEYGEEKDYLTGPEPGDPLEDLFEGIPEDALIHEIPQSPEVNVIIDEPDKQEALDLLEMEMIQAHPGVPVFIKEYLGTWKEKGKIHELFLIYFDEDGTIKQQNHDLIPQGFKASPELILGQQIRRAFNHAN